MRYLLSICSVAFALVGCTRTATMSWREFNAGVISKHPDDLIWYCGSKDGYDCFRLVSLYDSLHPDPSGRGESERDYRVLSTETPVTSRHPFSTNRASWVSWQQAAGMTHG